MSLRREPSAATGQPEPGEQASTSADPIRIVHGATGDAARQEIRESIRTERRAHVTKMQAMHPHLLPYLGFFFPFASLVIPLALWMSLREKDPTVAEHAKESFHFQASMTAYFIVSVPLMMVAIGFVLLPVVFLFWVIAPIVAAMKAHAGELMRYPLTIRFLK